MNPDADTTTIYPCPLPDCPFILIPEPASPAEHDGALAEIFGWGTFAAHAKSERLHRTEQQLRDHLTTHTTSEYAIALAAANKRITELTAGQP